MIALFKGLGLLLQDNELYSGPFEKQVEHWKNLSDEQMLEMARKSGLSIAEMKRANELVFRSKAELEQGIARLWDVMDACIERGMKGEFIVK